MDFSPLLRLAFCTGLLAILPGCIAKRSVYDVPDIPLTATYKNADMSAADAANTTASPPPVAPTKNEDAAFADWWRFFGNSELEGLINRGLANNADVRIATLRLAQSKVRADQAAAGLLPSVSMPLSVARQAPGGYVGSVPVDSSSNTGAKTYFQGSLRSELRLDVWGEQTAQLESAQLQLWRAAFERDNVQRNVTAAIASSYVEFIALNDRLRVAQATERVLSETLRTTEQRFELGDATISELEQQRAAICGLRAAIPTMEQQRVDAINTLAFMVGTVPGSFKLSEQGLDSLVLPAIVPGLPSSLLLRRPDVKMAEARLLAADADIDVARTRILPPLDLTTQAGYSANYLAQFFQPQQFFWTAIGNLTASIFDAGRRRGEKKYAEAMYEEMVESYARTIYQAIREVESALATVNLANKRMLAQEEAAFSAKRAWDASVKSYTLGGIDQMALLDAERSYHRYQDEYQRSRMDHYRGYITLFQALGGGVRPAGTLPGKGRRPSDPESGPTVRASANAEISNRINVVEGLDWHVEGSAAASAKVEKFWQIELPGLYHRSTVGAAWRDLRERYPEQMASRIVRPRLSGKIDDEGEGVQEAWYRLYVAKFDQEAEAHAFCDLMMTRQERCRVISSQSNEKSERNNVPLPKPPVVAASENSDSSSASEKTIRSSGVPATPSSEAVKPSAQDERKPASPAPEKLEKPVLEQATAKEEARSGTPTAFTVQLGAFSNLENAHISSVTWQSRGYAAYITKTRSEDGREWYAVRTGTFVHQKEGTAAAQAIRSKEDAPAVVVPMPVNANGKPDTLDVGDITKLSTAPETDLQPEPPEARPPVTASPTVPAAAQKPAPRKEGKPAYAVQLGAFSNPQNAQMSLDFWRARGLSPYLAKLNDDNDRPWYAVRTGFFPLRREASALALQLGRKEKISALVVSARKDNILPASSPETSPTITTPAVDTSSATPPKVAESGEPEKMITVPQQNTPLPETTSFKAVPAEPEKAPEPPAPAVPTPSADSPALAEATPSATEPVRAAKSPRFSIQLGAFATIENAATAYAAWIARGYQAYVCEMTDRVGKLRFAVRVGGFSDKREGLSQVRSIRNKEKTQAVLVSSLLDSQGQLAMIDVMPLLTTLSQLKTPPTDSTTARDAR